MSARIIPFPIVRRLELSLEADSDGIPMLSGIDPGTHGAACATVLEHVAALAMNCTISPIDRLDCIQTLLQDIRAR